MGNSIRATAATGMNDKSSRSHSVFTMVMTQTKVLANTVLLLSQLSYLMKHRLKAEGHPLTAKFLYQSHFLSPVLNVKKLLLSTLNNVFNFSL